MHMPRRLGRTVPHSRGPPNRMAPQSLGHHAPAETKKTTENCAALPKHKKPFALPAPLPRPKQRSQAGQPTGKGALVTSSWNSPTRVAPVSAAGHRGPYGCHVCLMPCSASPSNTTVQQPHSTATATATAASAIRTGDSRTGHRTHPQSTVMLPMATCLPQHDPRTTQHTQHTQCTQRSRALAPLPSTTHARQSVTCVT